MKKFISIALLLALCLGLFAGCDKNPQETTPVNPLANAKSLLFQMYNTAAKDEENKLLKDKELTSVVVVGGVSYPVEWSVTVTAGPADSVKIAEAKTPNNVLVDVTEQPEEEIHFTLTGTIKDEAGNSETVTLKCFTPAAQKPEGDMTTVTLVTNPEAGATYKLGMYQGNLGQTLYFAGTTANTDYYMTTTEDINAATDMTLEAVEGGFKMFFMVDGVKTYLDVYKNGDYVNLRLTAEPTAVWTWNTEFNTMVADVEGEAYYCGTYKEYNTLSASKLSYAATSFPSNLYAVEKKAVTATVVDAPVAGTAYKVGMVQGNLGQTLYFAGTVANKDYYMATTEDLNAAVDMFLEEVEGGYKLYFMVDGVKTYLDVYKSGDYVNLRLTTEPTAVWTWNTEYKTLVSDVEGEAYYFGTYNEYNTLSASKLSYAATSFPANFYQIG